MINIITKELEYYGNNKIVIKSKNQLWEENEK